MHELKQLAAEASSFAAGSSNVSEFTSDVTSDVTSQFTSDLTAKAADSDVAASEVSTLTT